jgi:hypothetical protein
VISLYLTVAIVALMIAYAGYEGTMRLFAYIDLQIRFIPLRFRIELMKYRLKRQLDKDRNYWTKIKEKDHAKSN